ncbi:ATP-grasp domain-containing protein [Neptuniibacter sp. QD37_11]|uniref:ATP-grasp domain-containing protein n=1 Tax=Neptuniibacter sp. QD37_11 TaxID=3398209 RepID=UPI0039F5BF98
MINPIFFVQNNHVVRLTGPVADFAFAEGYSLEDRSSNREFNPDKCGVDWPVDDLLVLPYGSVQFIRKIKESSLGKFIWHEEDRFAATTWMPILADDALNSHGKAITVSDINDALEEFGPLHLRPDKIDKAFLGGVYTRETWAKHKQDRCIDEDLVCWASPLTEIEAEWRCWVIGGYVIEISLYRRNNKMACERHTNPDLFQVAQALADKYIPAPCVVMDIALTKEGYKVIEYNPIHCSGWYGADSNHVLKTWADWSERRYGEIWP